ncbi:MAG: response regulator transcription factor [Anaerolineales bacterium]|nr:response regulator transcription factor [Anaerolineales bacterium]
MIDPIRVILVDAHDFVRQSIRLFLDDDSCFRVVAEASTGAQALDISSREPAEVILIDWQLLDMSGPELCSRVLEICPHLAVIIMTTIKDPKADNICSQAGARLCLLKDSETLHLRKQIMAAIQRCTWLAPGCGRQHHQTQHGPALLSGGLDPCEIHILSLIARGHTDEEITSGVNLDLDNVRQQIDNIMLRLNVSNRVEAVQRARTLFYL